MIASQDSILACISIFNNKKGGYEMKHKNILNILLAVVLVFSMLVPGFTAFAVDNIFEIFSVEDFKKFLATDSDFSGSKIVLQNDITVNDGIFSLDENNNPLYDGSSELPESFAPIERFKGVFDGQGYTISGAYISSENSAGLFGKCYGATIKNLNIKNSLIIGDANVGSVCGAGYDTNIKDCISEAIVIGNTFVGGVIGFFYGDITSCFFKGTVVGGVAVGGVVGDAAALSSIIQSGNSGTVYADYACGGFAGVFEGNFIDSCFNTGDIYGSYVGGFIGEIGIDQHATKNNIPFSIINSCYTCGNITAKEYGGFCYSSYGDFSLFFGCYFKGESEKTADYSGNLYKDYMKFCDNIASMSTMPIIVPDFIFAVDENTLKLNNSKPLPVGCEDFVEDKGNENKGFMIPISLHKVHAWDEYVYNNDATCEETGTKTAACSAFGCREKNTVYDMEHPAMGHSFGEYILDEDGTTETARCQHDGCEKTDTKPHVHTWGEYVYNNDAECEKDGTMTAHCTKDGCKAVNTVADPEHKMTEHSFGEWKSNKDAKLFKNGTESRVCSICGIMQTQEVAKSATIVVIFDKIVNFIVGLFK